MTIGRNIRALRQRRGLTLDELSALCGVNRDDLGRYERGEMTPRPGTVQKIAAALDAPIVAIQEGMGWTMPRAVEKWETPGETPPLYDGILETLKESGEETALEEGDILALMESVKAAIPALVEYMKDTRPEPVIHSEILKEIGLASEESEAADIAQYELSDAQWEQLRGLLPSEKAGKGRAFKSNRLMLDGILCWLKTGTAWRNLPEKYGRHQCVSGRLRLWNQTGVWAPLVQRMLELGILDKDTAAASLAPRSQPANKK